MRHEITRIAKQPVWVRISRWGQGYNFDVRDAGGMYQAGNPIATACRYPVVGRRTA